MRIFQHFKGGKYELLHEGFDSETQEPVIVYKSLQDGKIWIRKAANFFSFASENTPRFKEINENHRIGT